MPNNKESKYSFFAKERTTKIVVLVISLVFWLFVKLSKEYRTSENLEVVYELPDSLAWSTPPPASIHVSYSGEGWSLFRSFSKKKLTITPQDCVIGASTMDRRDILPFLEKQLSDGVRIIDFTPDNFPLGIDRRLRKKLPVKVFVQPTFELGYTQKGPIWVIPDSVVVHGPEAILATKTFIGTELWSPEDCKSSIVDHRLKLLNDDQTLLFIPNEVMVTMNVEQFTEKSFFVPIELLNSKDSIRIFPDKIKISFSIPLSQFDEVQSTDFQLVADFKEIKPGSQTNTLPIQVRKQPSIISNLRFRSKAIEFFIEKE